MVDVMSAEKRSALMSRIRGKDTSPEMCVRKYLWEAGLRYRLHPGRMPGRPDMVLKRWNAVVFVHGCFWHSHAGCSFFRLPKTRVEFWEEKLRLNRERDERTVSALAADGWRVAIVWECAVRADPLATGHTLATWVRHGVEGIQIEGAGGAVRHRALESALS